MRIDLPLVTILLAALSCACPSKSDPGTSSPGGTPSPAPQPPPSGEDPGAPSNPGNPGGDARTAAVAADHPQYQRVEGTSFQNGCSADDQCFVGGCSNEVCSAEQGVSSTCEAPADGWPTSGATCGCVKGQCVWYKAGGGSGSAPPQSGGGGSGGVAAAQGQECPAGKCAKGLTCVKYYGVAGTSGPQFTSCEIPCSGGCPSGQSCTMIADGPGQVCRPAQ
jgi:hypothetical protein